MWKTLSAAVTALVIGGIATAFAAVRQDDRLAGRHAAEERAREVRLTLPRTAAGAIDVPKLIVEIRAAMTRGVREIRFRDTALSANDVMTLRELAARFGFERVRIHEGRRVRVEFRDRDELRRRADVRDEDGRARNEARVQRPEKLERADKVDRAERQENADRPERRERAERGERPDRSGRR